MRPPQSPLRAHDVAIPGADSGQYETQLDMTHGVCKRCHYLFMDSGACLKSEHRAGGVRGTVLPNCPETPDDALQTTALIAAVAARRGLKLTESESADAAWFDVWLASRQKALHRVSLAFLDSVQAPCEPGTALAWLTGAGPAE